MTLLALLPLWWFWTTFLFGAWVGIAIYGGVILPWALRDIWRRTDLL